MKHLIDRGLMFGNLIHVSSPALVERYSRALTQLTGRPGWRCAWKGH